MDEHPEDIKLSKTDHKQIPDDEVDSLSVPHGWEII